MARINVRARWLALVWLPLAGGCDLTDLDINTDPNAAPDAEGDVLFPTVVATIAANRAIEISPGQALFAQIWAANGSAGVFTDPEQYVISSFMIGNSWGAFFTTSLRNLQFVRDEALEAELPQPNTAAQAEITMAYVFWMLTTMWETVPFTEALDEATFPTPVFDDQETVLRGIVDMLDQAIARIDETAPPGLIEGDLIYDGDMDLWRRFANSLKLRTLMLIRNQDASVDSQIAALLEQPLIRDNVQEAAIPFFAATGNENNMWKLNNQFAGFVNAMNGSQFVYAGETLVELMKDMGDPRIDTYFELAVEDFNIEPDGGGHATTEHFGQRASVEDFNDGRTSMLSQNIVRRDWPSRVVPAAEVWLYEAEFRASQGDLGGAHVSYIAGVEAGLDFFDGKPGAIPESAKQAYLSSLPASFSSLAAAMDAIHAQQYIEVFDRAPENWTQWRRTKFPSLPVPENAVLGDIIRRMPIPPDERSANPNAPPVVPLDQPMWFER